MPPEPRPPVTGTTGHPSWLAPVMPVVPDHELLRRIGGGSYGDVWLARTAVGTWRAVKIVFRDRFTDARPYEREFNGMQKFEPLSRGNEGFIDILQIGRNDAEGYFYYVMELADDAGEVTPVFQPASKTGPPTESEPTGKSALQPETYVPKTLSKALLQRGRLPLGECLELGLTLNLGLAHLHRAGLIHRDIKPSNIIFVGGVPKLADIGLVIETAEARSYVGTEGFIPPEGPNSPQADLFSLGKVLYEAGMGKDRKDFPEPFTQIIDAPDSKQLLEFNAILLKACAANVTERYQSAEEMNADLALLQSGGSVRRQRKLAGQLRFVQRAGAFVTALAAVIALGWWWQAKQTQIVRNLATEKTQLAEEKTQLVDVNRQRIVRLDISNGVRLLDEGDPAGALFWFADALPLLSNKPAEETIHRIRIQQTLNQIPRLLQVFPLPGNVFSSFMFSRDGGRIVTGTTWGELHVWDARTGEALMKPQALGVDCVYQTRLTRDGQQVFASSLPPYGFVEKNFRPTNIAAIIEVGTGRRLASLSGTNLVRADLSPDERWLVTADTDHVIRVHDARDGRPVADLRGHTDRIIVFSFSANGNILASSSLDRTVRFWRLPSGEQIGLPIQFARERGAIPLSQDGTLLATTESDPGTNSIIEFWNVETGARIGPPIEMAGSLRVVGFLPPDDQRLWIVTDKDNGVFARESHARLFPPIKIEREFRNYAISPDGQRVAMGGAEGLMGVWSLESGERVFPPALQKRDLVNIEFSPDGTQLLTAGKDGTVLLHSLHPQESASYRFDATIAGGSSPQSLSFSRRFSPDRKRFLFNRDGMIRLVDFDRFTDQPIPPPEAAHSKANWCFFDASGRQWAITYVPADAGGSYFVELWREAEHTTNRFVLPHPARVSNLMFTLDGSRLITFGDDRQFRFWKTADGSLERSVALPEELTGGGLFPDGHTAFAVYRENAFALFDLITRQRWNAFVLFDLITGSITKTPISQQNITDWAFDPTTVRFATASREKWTRVWSTRTGEPLTPRLDHGGEVRWAEFSPDGKRILTAGLTPEARVWDVSTGEQLFAPLRLGAKPLEVAHWSLDGRFIVARSDDDLVRVWDSATGEAVTPQLKHNGYVRLASLVANNRLVTLSLPNLMRAWDLTETPLPLDVLGDYAKLLSGRRLNAQGVMLTLMPQELVELSRSLHARAPQLFATP